MATSTTVHVPLFGGAFTVEAVRTAAARKLKRENRNVDDGEIQDALDAGMDKLVTYWLPKYEHLCITAPSQGFNYAVRCVSQRAGVWLQAEYKRRRRLERAWADPVTRRQLQWCSTVAESHDEAPRQECPCILSVREQVALLAELRQDVVGLRYWAGLPDVAIADELGVSPRTVAREHRAALDALKAHVPAPATCPVCRCRVEK